MSALFGGGQSQPATPQVAVAPPMPDPNSPSVMEATNAAAVTALQRSGRSSTVLAKQGTPAAAPRAPVQADAYAGTKLGSQ